MKKVKLFTTIASLCLAVALMAFGVYAATQVSYTVKGNISFNATALDGTWMYEVVKGTGCATDVAKTNEGNTAVSLNFVDGATTATFTVKAYFTPTTEVATGTVTVVGVEKDNVTYGATTAGAWSTPKTESTAATIEVTVTVPEAQQGSNGTYEWEVTFTATAGKAD